MRNNQPEEQFPLLLLFLEDGQRSARASRRLFVDKGRYHGITSGVSAVITQWPGHLTTCLTTALFIGLLIILFAMLMLVVSVTPGSNFLTNRCKTHIYNQNNLSTVVHLVHGPQQWSQNQLDMLEDIAKKYGPSNVDLIIIQNVMEFNNSAINYTTNAKTLHKEKRFNVTHNNTRKIMRITRYSRIPQNITLPWDNIRLNINIGAKGLLKMLLDHSNIVKRQINATANPTSTQSTKIKTFNELLAKFPTMHVQNYTYEEVFKNSPLFFTWHKLSEVTKLFAIRVLQIWNYAGITFDLPELNEFSNEIKYPSENNSLTLKLGTYQNLVNTGLPFFRKLPEGLVTVDDRGLHMETKTVCHAFFGEILMALRKTINDTLPSALIQDTLKSFCRRGAVDMNYCRRILV